MLILLFFCKQFVVIETGKFTLNSKRKIIKSKSEEDCQRCFWIQFNVLLFLNPAENSPHHKRGFSWILSTKSWHWDESGSKIKWQLNVAACQFVSLCILCWNSAISLLSFQQQKHYLYKGFVTSAHLTFYFFSFKDQQLAQTHIESEPKLAYFLYFFQSQNPHTHTHTHTSNQSKCTTFIKCAQRINYPSDFPSCS